MGWQRRRRMKSRVSGSRLLSREWSCLGGTQARCSSQWPATTRGDPVWRRLPHQGMSPGLSLTGEFQLNSNLAAGVERAKEAERREREEDERKAREERERRNLAEEEEQRKREKKEQQQKEADQRRMKEVEERKWREELEQR